MPPGPRVSPGGAAGGPRRGPSSRWSCCSSSAGRSMPVHGRRRTDRRRRRSWEPAGSAVSLAWARDAECHGLLASDLFSLPRAAMSTSSRCSPSAVRCAVGALAAPGLSAVEAGGDRCPGAGGGGWKQQIWMTRSAVVVPVGVHHVHPCGGAAVQLDAVDVSRFAFSSTCWAMSCSPPTNCGAMSPAPSASRARPDGAAGDRARALHVARRPAFGAPRRAIPRARHHRSVAAGGGGPRGVLVASPVAGDHVGPHRGPRRAAPACGAGRRLRCHPQRRPSLLYYYLLSCSPRSSSPPITR